MMLGTDDFYVFVHYNLTGSLASVRCVRNEGGAHYLYHTPTEPQTYEGFELTVTCQSELDEFEVMVACEEEQFVEKAGKDRLTVSFDIPANDGTEDRVYKIYVNDDYTGPLVTPTYQAGSDSYLSRYTWTAERRFFRNRPRRRIFSTRGPRRPSGGDPCRLVAPADTWRLPTRSEIEALNGTAGDSLTLNGVLGQSYAGGALFVPTAGILYDNTGAGLAEYRGQGEFGYIIEHENLFDVFRGRGMRGLSRRGKLRSLSALREKRELCVLCFPYALDRPDIRRFRSDGYVQERLGRVPGSGQGRRRGPDGRCVENLADGPVLYSGK